MAKVEAIFDKDDRVKAFSDLSYINRFARNCE